MMDILGWAKRFIETPSVSRDGNAAIARLAAELIEHAGGRPELVPTRHQGVEHFTLIADFGPAPGPELPGLLLVTHLDTVPPGNPSLWTETGGDPFAPTLAGDALYGLGSADAKVDLVAKAAALQQLDLRSLERPLRVVGTFAEEIGLVGARWLVANGHTKGYGHALVSEPSELVGIRAHKGYSVFEAEIPLERIEPVQGTLVRGDVEGASAHSSTPHLGRNAIEAALERLAAPGVRGVVALHGGEAANQVPAHCLLSQVNEGDEAIPEPVYDPAPLLAFHAAWRERLARLAETKDADFDPDCTVGNLGRVALDKGRARFTFDLRLIPGAGGREAVEPLSECAEIRVERENPPLATPADGTLVRAVRAAQAEAGLPERIDTKATCTEAGLLAESGLQAVVIGAGRSIGNVHRPNEHTSVRQLHQARDFYKSAITHLCMPGGAR